MLRNSTMANASHTRPSIPRNAARPRRQSATPGATASRAPSGIGGVSQTANNAANGGGPRPKGGAPMTNPAADAPPAKAPRERERGGEGKRGEIRGRRL